MSDKPHVWFNDKLETVRVDWLGPYDSGMDHSRSEHELIGALVRALLAVEWKGPQVGRVRHCSACGGAERHDHDYNSDRLEGPSCPLDAALSAAGFESQASRDEARRLMAEAKR